MFKPVLVLVAVGALATAAVHAQNPPAAATPAPAPAKMQGPAERPAQPRPVPVEGRGEQPAPARAAEPVGQAINIKLDITITDQAGPGEPVRKQVTMLMADGQNANVRTSGRQRVVSSGDFPISINVDARPIILRDGSIRLSLGLEYQPRPSANQPEAAVQAAQMSALNERLIVILQDGKPLVISQASDPGSDWKITVELRAAIQK
jgi:hypothetical protein